MKRILILESDRLTLSIINDHLKKKGNFVDCVQDIDRVEILLLKYKYDLFICEVTLENDDILVFLNSLKEKKLFMRVLALSYRKSLSDRISILKTANDFLAKPFNSIELCLKIDNLLSLEKSYKDEFIENSLFLFKDSSCSNNENHLRPQELKILECLFKHKNMVISYETISSYVWDYRDAFPLKKTISVYIRRIRTKLFLQNLKIITVKNRGYKLIYSLERNT